MFPGHVIRMSLAWISVIFLTKSRIALSTNLSPYRETLAELVKLCKSCLWYRQLGSCGFIVRRFQRCYSFLLYLQRDRTDITVLKNMGVGLGHSLLAYRSTLQGMAKIQVCNGMEDFCFLCT